MPSKARDVTQVRLTPQLESQATGRGFSRLIKLSLYPHIEKAFGWEGRAQCLRFDSVYRDQITSGSCEVQRWSGMRS